MPPPKARPRRRARWKRSSGCRSSGHWSRPAGTSRPRPRCWACGGRRSTRRCAGTASRSAAPDVDPETSCPSPPSAACRPFSRPAVQVIEKSGPRSLAIPLLRRGAWREHLMPRVLLVDDDPAWRKLYRMALESQFDLFEATDGYQALSVLGTVRPDVIVLDLRMPRMDGLDFIQRLSRRSPRPKVIICSGTFTEADRPQIAGVSLAAKTPDLKELWSALRSMIPTVAEVAVPAKQAVEEDAVWRD